MSLTALAFWITYVWGVTAAVFNPIVGVFLYILVYHLNPETQWWGASVQAVGLRTSFTVALATGVGVILRWPRMEHGEKQFPLPISLAVLFGGIAIGSLAWGVDITPRGQYHAEKFVKVLIFLFLMIRCVRTPTHYQLLVMGWLIGVLYLGYQAQGGVGQTIDGRLSAGLGGPDFAESSDLAVHLVATLPLIGAVFFMARTWLGRGFALATGALAVNMLIMTRTRNALVGLSLMAFSCVLALPRGYRVRGVVGVLIGSFLAFQLTDPGWWTRMASVWHYKDDPSSVWRLVYWQAAVEMVSDYPFGIGLGNFHHFIMEYIPGLTYIRSAHNTFLACLAELGWPGFIIFLMIVIATLWRLADTRRLAHDLPAFCDTQFYTWRSRFHLGWHAVALRAGLIGYLGCGMFTTRLYSEDFWLLLGFAACLHNLSKYVTAQHELELRAVAPRAADVVSPGIPATAHHAPAGF